MIVVSSSCNMVSIWKRTKDFSWVNVAQLYDKDSKSLKDSSPTDMPKLKMLQHQINHS